MANQIESKEVNIIIKADSKQAEKSAKDLEAVFYSIEQLTRNGKLASYWKNQEVLMKNVTKAYKEYTNEASIDNAKELLKTTNALKAISEGQLPKTLKGFEQIEKTIKGLKNIELDQMFSQQGFEKAFKAFDLMEKSGLEVNEILTRLGSDADTSRLQTIVTNLTSEVEKLTRRLINARNANEELRKEFENFKAGSGFADKLDELDRLKLDMQNIRNEAIQTFNQFLDANKIDRYDRFSDDRFAEYFEKLENGTLTATDAIRRFKSEYSYLLEESYKSSGDSFGLNRLQDFSTKLDSIFHQVEGTSNKINNILSNGVIAKSVQNLSEDTTLPDSQRSIFGNILQDEESLKSITALFQKIIDETNQTKNTEVFNTEQFTKIESLFTSIESSLSSIKGVLVDVGDGEELSPLLKTITKVESAINNLSSSVKNIGLNMNIDIGSDKEMEAKAQAKIANALQAYQRLFDHLKVTAPAGEIIGQKFFDFDISQYDTTRGKLEAYVKFIKDIRNEAKSYFNGQDVLYTGSDKKYWTQASSAAGQVTKVFNEIKAASNTNPLENLFGKTDLSPIISQLENIVIKLDEISISANKFVETFKSGLNISTSVKEVESLTARIKELEAELAKVKIAPVTSPIETNISFGDSTSNAIDTQVKKQREYNDLVAVGYDRIQKMKRISESGTTGQNSVYDLLRLNHEAWDEVKANNFFNTIPEEGLKRYIKILEVVEKIVQEMVQASGLTEDQIVSQLKNIKSAQGGNFKLNGADSGWTHFATYSNGQKDSMQKPNGITYKVYAAFDDIKDLNQNVVSSIMDELTKAGFKGRLKTTSGSTSFGDKLNGLAITDQMVVHGSTKKDQEIAYNTLKNMGLKLSYLGGGIDTPDGSFSQTLASGEINKYVQGLEKEATTARDTAKAEQELANARKESTSTVSQNQKKDAFQGSSTKAEASANAINKENEALKQTANTATEAATAKEKFTKANSKVKESADASVGSVNQEAEALANAGKSATNGLNSINEFRPNTTGFDELISKLKITEEEAKRIESIIVNSNYSVAAKKTLDSYNVRYKNGDSRVIGENSQTDRGNTLGSREILYNDKQIQQLDTIREKIKALKKDCFSEKNGRAGTQYGLGEQFNDAVEKVDKLTAAFNEGKLSLSTYKKNIDSVINSYNRLVTIQQNRDMDRVNSNQKAVTAALREQLTAYKNICSVREKLAGIKNKDGSQDEVIRALNKEKELYLNNFKIASSFLKNNKLYFDSILQVNKLLEQQLKSETKIAAKRASINKSNDTTSSSKVNVNTINEANRRINSLNNSLNELKNTNGFRKVKSDFDEIFNSRTNFYSLEKYRNAIDQLRKLLSEAKKINTETNSALNRVNNQFTNLSSSDILKSTFSKQLAESSLVIEKLNADFKNGTISIDEYNTKTRQTLSNLAELKRLGNGQILGSVNSVTTIDAAKQQVLNYASQNSKKISKPINVSAPDSNGIRTITTEIITQENEIQKLTAKWSAATNTVSLSTKTMGTEVSATTKLIQGFANKWKQLAQYMTAMYLNPYMLIYRIRDMITTVSELDYELMDLRKTADMSTSELHEFYLESNNVAKEMGVSTKEILSQASAWSRLGYNTKQTATEMAKLSSQFATISPGMEVDEATTGLVSVMKAFDITTDEVKSEIMDKINIVGNNFATNNQEIIEGLQRMSSAMASTGADLEDTIALFTAGQEVVQDAEQVGSAIKSFSMRIRGMEETGEYLDELKDIKGDVYELTNGKVHIMEDENTYRPVLDILRDISEVWSEITDKNRAKLLEKLFAKTRANKNVCPYVQKCA